MARPTRSIVTLLVAFMSCVQVTTAVVYNTKKPLVLITFDKCSLEPYGGNCRAAFMRWFYNHTSKSCETFTYGGCNANLNNFEEKNDCEKECKKPEVLVPFDKCNLEPHKGYCRAIFWHWYYNHKSQSCERFIYGGCGANLNFKEKKDCEEECEKPLVLVPFDKCKLEPFGGNCKAAFQRWYYDHALQSCKIFTYGGCNGNLNNFREQSDCEKECKKPFVHPLLESVDRRRIA